MDNIKKILIKIFFTLVSIVILIYLSIIGVLFYIGPLETRTVKQNLKDNPVNIVVSLTTTPDKINQIQPVLKSIYRQSIKPDRIYLNIPREFNIIPNWLKTDSKIIINITNDYGPATKLIATLEKERDPNAIIITVNDDYIYPKHMVRDLVKQYLPGTYKVNYKLGAAITGVGVNNLIGPDFNLDQESIVLGNKPSLNIVSAGGVAYKRNFFKDDIFLLMDNVPKSCIASDDLMISAYLLVNGASIVKISGMSYNESIKKLLLKKLPGNIAQNNLSYDYSHCLAVLPKYNKLEYQKSMLERSKVIYMLSYSDIFRLYMAKSSYNYLNKIINNVPFVRTMIVSVMG